jgi:nicotinate-nucleotide pyrophosphorylase (carboxylating)
MKSLPTLPPWIILDPLLTQWLQEDIGRGDRSTQGLIKPEVSGNAVWVVKEAGVIAGLSLAKRIFWLVNPEVVFTPLVEDGTTCEVGTTIATISGSLVSLLMAERTSLNLVMRLSGIATATSRYVAKISGLPTQLVDTRKTTPGLRILEKYATLVGGGVNHRIGLDDGVMIKDNHIIAAGGITPAIKSLRSTIPYPMTIEVETESLSQVEEAILCGADIIMLDNMGIETMREAVQIIRTHNPQIKIEASGNITLDSIYQVAETGVDYISTSAPITRSTWLDLSMGFIP